MLDNSFDLLFLRVKQISRIFVVVFLLLLILIVVLGALLSEDSSDSDNLSSIIHCF